jgi:hypothetical protein
MAELENPYVYTDGPLACIRGCHLFYASYLASWREDDGYCACEGGDNGFPRDGASEFKHQCPEDKVNDGVTKY